MEINKRNITLRINKQVQKLIAKYSEWFIVETPQLCQRRDGMTDSVYLAKPYHHFTNLLIIFDCSISMRRYSISVGWSDILPIPEPNIESLVGTGFWLDYYKQGLPTREFEESYMDNSLETLHSQLTRNRYPVHRNEEDDDFEKIFQDIETLGIEYWNIMLKRRFNIDNDNFTL